MSVKMRLEVERKIAKALVKDALAAGYSISVDNGDNNGEEFEVRGATDARTVLKNMFKTDEDRLHMSKDDGRTHFGWVLFIYGNDGWDVISDYTVNLEPIMAGANKVSKRYE
jgi:hypothetical protein